MRKPIMIVTGVLGGGGIVTYSISGTVYDADGSTAVSGATVALGTYTADSGVDGTYSITDIPAGESGSMTCTKAGYSWTAKTISAMSGNLTAQNYTNAWWAGGGCAALIGAAWEPVGADSLDASYLRIAGVGGNADIDPAVVGGTAPTWDATNGWKFDAASNQYLKSGITPNAGTYSMIIRYSNAITSDTACIAGASAAGKTFYMRPSKTTDSAMGFNVIDTTEDTFASEGTASGVMAIAAKSAYKNGSLLGVLTASAAIDCTEEIFIGAIQSHATGLAANYWTGYIQAIAIYTGDISAYIAQITAGANALP